LVVVRRQLEGVSDEELANGDRARRRELGQAREAVSVALGENQAAFNQAVHQVSSARRPERGGVLRGVPPIPEPNAPVASRRARRSGRVVTSRGAHPVTDSRPSGGPGAGRSPAGRENVAEQARQARQAQAREIAREVRISSFGSEAEVTLRRVFSHVIVSFGSPERSRAE